MSNTILSLDTSTHFCSVAIYKEKNIFSFTEKCEKEHNIKILPMIQKILLHTNTKLTELNYIAFSNGPGNFTGIRITASVAQSFSLSLKIPIINISTLLIMAEQAWRKYQKKKLLSLFMQN